MYVLRVWNVTDTNNYIRHSLHGRAHGGSGMVACLAACRTNSQRCLTSPLPSSFSTSYLSKL